MENNGRKRHMVDGNVAEIRKHESDTELKQVGRGKAEDEERGRGGSAGRNAQAAGILGGILKVLSSKGKNR